MSPVKLQVIVLKSDYGEMICIINMFYSYNKVSIVCI